LLFEFAADQGMGAVISPMRTGAIRVAGASGSEGKRLGRPPIAPELEERIRAALDKPGRTEGVRKIASRFGVNPGTVQRISRPFEGVAASAATA
jgi:hypothetical protein